MVVFKLHNRRIQFSSGDILEKKQVKSALTFAMEGTEHSRSFKNNKWDGLYRFYDKDDTFETGMLSVVMKALTKRKIESVVRADFGTIELNGKKVREGLWLHQSQAIKVFCARPFGRVQFPTRTGKTVFAAELIRLHDGISLFVVDTQDLFIQAIDDISKHLSIPDSSIGQIGNDKFEIKKINVATIQTLHRYYYSTYKRDKNKENRKINQQKRKCILQLFDDLKFLVVDECHEHGSKDRLDMYRAATKNADAILGLSATHTKSEDPLKNIRLQAFFGDILFVADQKDLKARGVLAKEQVMLILIDHNKNKNIKVTKKDAYDSYENKVLIHNSQRNQIIVNVTEFCRRLQLKTLVLFQYRDHAQEIKKITGDDYISGLDKVERRSAVRKIFLRRKGGVLLVTNIFKKGITLPQAEVFLNAGGGLEKSEVIQKKGRVLGVTNTKDKALIVDFVDIYQYFDRHSLQRIEVYEQHAGIENIAVFDFNDKDFYHDVMEYLSTWKEQT